MQNIVPITPVNITPGTPDSYQDRDCSPYIPEGATGVLLHIANTGTSSYQFAVRKNGSTDDFYNHTSRSHLWVGVGVDENRIFEAKVNNTTYMQIWLCGYTLGGVVFYTNAIDKSPTAGDWYDMDCSSEAPDAIALFYLITGTVTFGSKGIRKNGSTDDRHNGAYYNDALGALIGCDDNQICEGYRDSTKTFYLIGYVIFGVEMNTNATDVSLETTESYQDITVDADAKVAFIEVLSTSYVYLYALRKKDSSEDIYERAAATPFAFPECDDDGKIEGKISNTIVDFFVVGWAVEFDSELLVGTEQIPNNPFSGSTYFALTRFQAVKSGVMNKFWIFGWSANAEVKVAIYEDDSGEPGALIAANNTGQLVVQKQWNVLGIPDASIVSGNYYWLAVCQSDQYVTGAVYPTTAQTRYKAATYGTFTFPDPAGSGFTSTTSWLLCLAGWGSIGIELTGTIDAQATVTGELTSLAQVTDWKSPGTVTNETRSSGRNWQNPDNAKASDNSYASINMYAADQFTSWLRCVNFDFSEVPNGAIPVAVEFRVERQDVRYPGDNTHVRDDSVRMRTSEGQTGADKATMDQWQRDTDELVYYLWDADLPSLDAIKNSAFGIDIAAYCVNPGSYDAHPSVDHVCGRLYYIPQVALEGIIEAQAGMQGIFSVARKIAGAISAQSGVAGALKVSRELIGAIASQASVQGALRLSKTLSGTITGQSLVQGVIGLVKWLSGVSAAQSTAEGILSTGGEEPLVGEVAAQATIEGELKVDKKITGEVAALSGAQAELARVIKLTGTIAAQSSIAGELQNGEVLLAGIIAAATTAEGVLAGIWAITGEVAAKAEAEAVLTVPGPGQRQSQMFLVI
jgi:hypothetical protein